jgi:alkylation response protein AidB-like acyl-CoA dehydrogenase
MIAQAVEFVKKEVLPLQDRLDAQEDGLMPSLIAKAGELGFCGIDSPDAFGGLGLGKALAARILEMMSLNGSFSVTYGITSGISQLGLSLYGTDEQKAEFLPPLAMGEQIGAYALSEPDSGSDALSMSTKAELRNGEWVLDGTKMWISNAKWADQFLTMAKVDGRVTAFLVPRSAPGVSISREEHKMGLKGSSTARLVLEGARIPEANLLHEVGQGHKVAFNALNIGRFKLGAMSLGPARQAIWECAGYAQDRKQFGRPLSDFGLIRQKLADMAALYFAAEAALYRTGGLIDTGFEEMGGTVEGRRLAAEEYAVECSAVKVLCTEVEALIVDEALQIFGGYGFTEEFPMARLYRDARVSRIYEGTNEINRVFLADRLVRRLADQGQPQAAGDSFISTLLGQAIGRFDKDNQVLTGALSDITLLSYAEQSARLRAKQEGGLAEEAWRRFANWANPRAAAAYQIATGEAVSLPAPLPADMDALAVHILQRRAPLA